MKLYTRRLDNSGIDPFAVYVQYIRQFGNGMAFLLDGANESAKAFSASLIGICPLIDLVVKDRLLEIHVTRSLAPIIETALPGCEAGPHQYESVVPCACVYTYRTRDPLKALEEVRTSLVASVGAPEIPFSSGFFGYFGYDAVNYLEDLPQTTFDDRNLPDIRLQFPLITVNVTEKDIVVTDALMSLDSRDMGEFQHFVPTVLEGLTNPVALDLGERHTTKPVLTEDVAEESFQNNVRRARQYIESGDIFQVVLSKRLQVRADMPAFQVYEELRHLNPSPYMFFAEFPGTRIFGASPEVQFRVVNRQAEMKPIAGTSRGRGRTLAEDELLMNRLRMDEKECAEHLMLVDLCRNDLGRVCETGTVKVPEFLEVEAYSHLFHLVSKVTGELKSDVSIFHALVSTFPAGTLSGAPKIRAMEIIDELEELRRGPYGGLIGMIDLCGNANTAIIIRTIVEANDTYYVQVGAGIVADSDPAREWEECSHKAGALIDVLTRATTREQS